MVGESTTLVATGLAFSGAGPFYDVGFALALPSTVSACHPYPAAPEACVVTTDACLQ